MTLRVVRSEGLPYATHVDIGSGNNRKTTSLNKTLSSPQIETTRQSNKKEIKL